MPQKTVTLRISTALIQRLDLLCVAHQADPRLSPRGRLTRADILREAILRGCLELEHLAAAPSPLTGTPPNTALLPMLRDTPLLPALSRLPVDDPTALGDPMDADFEPYA